jgi:hypothetical protein
MRWWKVVGLAGLAGVAATGVVVGRAERKRRAYTSDEVRERLHQRLAETSAEAGPNEPGPHAAGPGEVGPDRGSDDIGVTE